MLFFVQVREDNVWMQSTGVINAKEMDLLFKVIIRVIMMGLLQWQQYNMVKMIVFCRDIPGIAFLQGAHEVTNTEQARPHRNKHIVGVSVPSGKGSN